MPTSQNRRVLTLLQQRAREGRGLNSAEMVRHPTPDGGKPVLRLAARIRDLRDQGYQFTSKRHSNNTVSYFYAGEVERAAEAPVAASVPPAADSLSGSLSGSLFDPHEFNQRPRGAYEEAA